MIGPREIPYGREISILIEDIQILAAGNMEEIRQRGRKGRYIARKAEAERFIKAIRSSLRQGITGLVNQGNEVVKDVKFPLDGKVCGLRVDVYLGYGPEARGSMKKQDVDNVLKGVYDALKEGPVYPAGNWGLINDDRYIVGGYCEKGEAPRSQILLRISRARIRTEEEMGGLVNMGVPIFPPFRAEDQSRIVRPKIVPGN